MKKVILFFAAVSMTFGAFAQTVEDNASGKDDSGRIQKYRRSSLYSVLVQHPTFNYGDAINEAFMQIPTPDKFNNHDLAVRSLVSSSKKMNQNAKKQLAANMKDINAFIEAEDVARNMVAKWFCFDENAGTFDMSLIQERGYYDASQADISSAEQSFRQLSMLGDAGEELIGKTFMVVHDITFIDHGENSAKAGKAIGILGSLAGAFLGSGVTDLAKMASSAVNEIDGFKVNITSYLYRLNWNEEVMGTFYNTMWSNPEAFKTSDIFTLNYIGETTTSASNMSSKSFSKKTKVEQMLRVCTRAIDKSIVELQREYDEFKVNVPIYKIADDKKTVEVQIGLKEGVNDKSRYEVLMAVQDNEGKMSYKRVGMLKPVAGQIWDNRFGALDEAAEAAEEETKESKGNDNKEGNVNLDATTFEIVEGANQIDYGCLVRECTIKTVKNKKK